MSKQKENVELLKLSSLMLFNVPHLIQIKFDILRR